MLYDEIVNIINNFLTYLVDKHTTNGSHIFNNLVIGFYSLVKNSLLIINPILFNLTLSSFCFFFLSKRLGIFVFLGFLLIYIFNLWIPSIETISMIFVSIFLSVLFGIPIGILGGYYPKFYLALKPILDLMQSIPSLVYLIPAIPFFGLGEVTAIFATLIFAIPPIIRFTRLGIIQVSKEVLEAAKSFGSNDISILFKIQIPLSLQSILEGINQSIMMAISMLVIASMVGAPGLGREVIYSIQRLNYGRGIISGLVISIIAIMLDRIMNLIVVKFSYLNTRKYLNRKNFLKIIKGEFYD